MTNLVALSSQTHRTLRFQTSQATRDHAGVNIVSVVPREFQRLLAHYPIFFTKSAETEPFEPVALLGFPQGENLYIVDGVWEAGYLPLQIQRHPFALLQRPANAAAGTAEGFDLALDLDSPYVGTAGGERLFEEDGKPSKFVENMSALLAALLNGEAEAHAFTVRLVELNLLEPVQIEIEFVDRSQTKLQGLHWMAAKALKELPAAALVDLRDRGYLEWIYFQMASLAQVPGLVTRKNKRLAAS